MKQKIIVVLTITLFSDQFSENDKTSVIKLANIAEDTEEVGLLLRVATKSFIKEILET